MKSSKKIQLSIAILTVMFISIIGIPANADVTENLSTISLPPGFEISIYAEGLDNPRSMVLGDNGTLFVGSRKAGNVYAVVDEDGDYKADKIHTLLTKDSLPEGTMMPNGVAFKDGSLYVAALSHIIRLDDIEKRLKKKQKPVIVSGDYPDARHHGWKFIAFGPDGKLYVPVGAPCNICLRDDEPLFATITRINADGSGREIIAHGVRNTVGFDWHPETGELWFTDNGVDNLGDDLPADELNRVTTPGEHFGFPHAHQGDILDVRFGQGHTLDEFTKPEHKLVAHAGALGMRFYTGNMFPNEYKNQIFIAEHGSWVSEEKRGYRISLVRLDGNRVTSYESFASGWENENEVWGRPADILILPDGSMLISDTDANVIYRISYKAQ